MTTTAIIVTYHSDAVLRQCLASLHEMQEIIVVDNGGTTAPEGVTFLHNRKNLGFGRAVNRAFAKVKTPYALLINPDAVLQKGALETLLKTATQNPEAAIISPVLEDSEGNIRTAWKLSHFQPRPCKTKQDLSGAFCVGHIAAAVWLLNMNAVKKIGNFDKGIFLFFEDDDYTLRARNADFSIMVEPVARAMHLQGKSSSASLHTQCLKHAHTARSALYFTEKYRGKKAAHKRAIKLCLNNSGRLLLGLITFRQSEITAAAARLSGILSFLREKR